MKLLGKHLSIVEKVFPSELENRLLDGKSTGAGFFACSEQGWKIPGIPRAEDLPTFVWQNLGGCIEIENLGQLVGTNAISDLVVFGHYPCGMLELVLSNQMPGDISGCSRKYMNDQTTDLKRILNEKHCSLGKRELMRKASELHIHRQILQAINSLSRELIERRGLKLHGWLWSEEESEVLAFDPAQGAFCK